MAYVTPMPDSPQNKLRPPCTKCGKPLLLTRREPEKSGFELRVYYCASCGASDRAIAPLWAGGSSGPSLNMRQHLTEIAHGRRSFAAIDRMFLGEVRDRASHAQQRVRDVDSFLIVIDNATLPPTCSAATHALEILTASPPALWAGVIAAPS